MKWKTSSWDRPSNSSANVLLPWSVSNVYVLWAGTHGRSWRRRASSSLRRISSFSCSSSSTRAASHSSRVPTLCSVIAFASDVMPGLCRDRLELQNSSGVGGRSRSPPGLEGHPAVPDIGEPALLPARPGIGSHGLWLGGGTCEAKGDIRKLGAKEK